MDNGQPFTNKQKKNVLLCPGNVSALPVNLSSKIFRLHPTHLEQTILRKMRSKEKPFLKYEIHKYYQMPK